MATTPKPDAGRNLQQRMLDVLREVGYIPKTGRGPEAQGGYAFARVEVIKDAVRDACVQAGVMVHTSMDGRNIEVIHGQRRDGSPATSILATVWGTMTFVNVDEPTEREAVAIHGQGIDTQDKAVSKATTSAVKNGLLNAFLIPTGDDPDAEGHDVPTQQAQARPRPVQPDGPPWDDNGMYGPDGGPRPDVGRCPKHDRPWKVGKNGNLYCSAPDPDGRNGYCDQRPSKADSAAAER